MSSDLENIIQQLKDFYQKNHRFPSYNEIAKLLGFASKNASFKLVRKLIELDVLSKDGKGKIIPKNIFDMPRPQLAKSVVTTEYLKKIIEDLLSVTQPLAEMHPHPKSNSQFLRVLEGTFRRDTFTLLAINELSEKKYFADSALDLSRKLIEDIVSIEFMIANDKEALGDRFFNFQWVQLHKDLEFFKTTGADLKAIGILDGGVEIEREYQKVRPSFLHRKGVDSRSWIGKDVEALIEELNSSGHFSEHDSSRTVIGYVKGCWKNHFNPLDIGSYLRQDLLDASSSDAMNQALVFSATSFYRLATRYIDEIRFGAGENVLEDVHQKLKEIWVRMNPED